MIKILESKRLVLRNFCEEDLYYLHEYRNNELCKKYQRWEDNSLDCLKKFIEIENRKSFKDTKLQLAIELKGENRLIGDIFVYFKDKTITIGYTISEKYQRKGYAYEILNEFIDYSFKNFKNYNEIVAMVHPDNIASKRLLEKLNFKNEGYSEKMKSVIYLLQI